MKKLRVRLLDHLEVLTGERPDLAPLSRPLPLFLRDRYGLFTSRLFGRSCLVALEADGWDPGSPGEYSKHASALRQHVGEAVVLVVPALPSHARNRMVQMAIPFIVPGSQVFLPHGLIDLREHFSPPALRRREALSPAAQFTVLYHLLHGRVASLPLKDVAKTIGYCPMMMTNVKDELEAAEICKVVRNGRAIVLLFNADGRDLWEQAASHMASPVRKAHWVQWANPGPPALLAGISALASRTMIADDRLPTYALPRRSFQTLLKKGVFAGCPDADGATARLEVWLYDPDRLADGTVVDPLSLFLSLRHLQDERVHHQLEDLMRDVKW